MPPTIAQALRMAPYGPLANGGYWDHRSLCWDTVTILHGIGSAACITTRRYQDRLRLVVLSIWVCSVAHCPIYWVPCVGVICERWVVSTPQGAGCQLWMPALSHAVKKKLQGQRMMQLPTWLPPFCEPKQHIFGHGVGACRSPKCIKAWSHSTKCATAYPNLGCPKNSCNIV